MNSQQLREQFWEDRGGIFNPGLQVEVNVNGVWIPGEIIGEANYTVRNTVTGRNVNRRPDQVRTLNYGTGENTNIIPGSQIVFQRSSNWLNEIPGTLVSKNYLVEIDHDRIETVPHTRLRRAPEGQAHEGPAPQPEGPAPQPEGPAPQPEGPAPQPEGPRLPQHNYEENQEIDALVNGVWRPGQIGEIVSYTVSATGTQRNVAPHNIRGQYRLGTRQRHNLRVNSPVEFRQGNRWLPGILTDIDYLVNIVDGGMEDVTYLNLRPRAREQPRAVAQPRAAAPPRAAAQPAGIAFEVHTEFDAFKASKWDKFMEIINRTTGRNTNFRNRERPFQPLIDYVSANASYTPEKKAEIIQKINRIFTQIHDYGNYEQNIDNITNSIQYVLMQPPEFIDAYINTFVVDCFKAYTRGSPESCTKGMYERIYLSFRDTASTLCLDKIQGVSAASPLCKPEYIEIFDCFYETIPQELLNTFASEWNSERGYDALSELTPEQRIEDFVGFIRTRMNDPVRFSKAEASIRRYANKEINTAFGGRRRRSQRRSSRKLRKTSKKRQAKRVRKTVKKRNNSRNKRSVKTRRY
jgi:hypothetical protein